MNPIHIHIMHISTDILCGYALHHACIHTFEDLSRAEKNSWGITVELKERGEVDLTATCTLRGKHLTRPAAQVL